MLGRVASGQIEQAQARKIIPLPEPLLHVLPFELRKLRRGHLSPVRRQLMIHFTARLRP